MKKAYIIICIPPTAALLVLLLIRLIFWQSEASLRPTIEEIDNAPYKHVPAERPNQGGGTGIKFDPDRLRKILEESKAEGGGETSSESSGGTPTISPKSESTPEVTEKKGKTLRRIFAQSERCLLKYLSILM